MILINTPHDGITFFKSMEEIPADLKPQKLAMSVVMGFTNEIPEPLKVTQAQLDSMSTTEKRERNDDITRFRINQEKELARENLLKDIVECNGCNAVIIDSAQFETINNDATAFIIRATLLNVCPA